MTIGLAGLAAQPAPGHFDWAFLIGPAPPDSNPDAHTPRSLPGVTAHFTDAQIHDLHHAVDWIPTRHPPMPDVVANGRGKALACAYCHQADGNGRPENMALAGLSEVYIVRQLTAFAQGQRGAEHAGFAPNLLMASIAKATSPAGVRAAAQYFSALKYTPRVQVVETATIPQPIEKRFTYVLGTGPQVPLGQRIIVTPASYERFEMRDPRMTYTAYVPPGAIVLGSRVASGAGGGQACSACHGPGLRGTPVAPPLAGRYPTGLVRQLAAFRAGTRSSAEGAPMRAVAAKLSDGQILALAAYAASLRP